MDVQSFMIVFSLFAFLAYTRPSCTIAIGSVIMALSFGHSTAPIGAPVAAQRGGDVTEEAAQQAELIRTHRSRLNLLKQRAAIQGINTDPSVLIEIAEITRQIQMLTSGH